MPLEESVVFCLYGSNPCFCDRWLQLQYRGEACGHSRTDGLDNTDNGPHDRTND